MHPKITYLSRALIVIALLMAAGIFAFFYRLGQNDAKALSEFMAAYANFDTAISVYSKSALASNPPGPGEAGSIELKAQEALRDLKTKASARISSLTKNDAGLMSTAQDIAGLSEREFEALKAYQNAAGKNANREALAQTYKDLASQRQAAFARFQNLGGQTN